MGGDAVHAHTVEGSNTLPGPGSLFGSILHNARLSSSAYVGVATLVAFLIFALTYTPSMDPREPPVLKATVPLVGHIIDMFRHKSGYISRLAEKAQTPIATLPILNGKLYVMFDPALVQAAFRHRNLSFIPFAVEFVQPTQGISEELMEIIRNTTLVTDFFDVMHPSLSGQNLHRMNAAALRYISDQWSERFQGGDWLEIPNLFLWVREFGTMATAEALYGAANPLRGRPDAIDDLWVWESGITLLALGIAPKLLARKSVEAQGRLAAVMSPYYEALAFENEDASEIARSRGRVLRKHGIPDKDLSRLETALTFVANANTIPTMFWFMSNIITRPELAARLREESAAVLERGGDGDDTVVIDISKLEERCPLLTSCYRETLRTYTIALGNRRVMEDATISDGKGHTYLLKKGVNVQVSSRASADITDIWGPTVQEFDPERFMSPSAAGGKSSSPSLTPEEEKMRRAAFHPFGGGKHLCPGRNFALAENLGLVVTLLQGFEVAAPQGQAATWKLPERETGELSQATVKPVRSGEGFGARIRRRQGMEKTKWTFKC